MPLVRGHSSKLVNSWRVISPGPGDGRVRDVHRQQKENYYVKKRSKTNYRRAVEAVEDARTSAQPAGSGVLDWRKTSQDTRQRLRWLLCLEG